MDRSEVHLAFVLLGNGSIEWEVTNADTDTLIAPLSQSASAFDIEIEERTYSDTTDDGTASGDPALLYACATGVDAEIYGLWIVEARLTDTSDFPVGL